jgi:threonine dehydrogenase-like Zn-dependent dehydrogenase
MFEDLKNALAKAETKGDVAVVLGAGTVGAAVDLIVSAHGAPSPGVVSALSASGALSAKKGWEARKDAKRAARVADKALGKARDAATRAARLRDFFAEHRYQDGLDAIGTQIEWHALEIIDDEQLEQAIQATRGEFLVWVKNHSAAPPFPQLAGG